MLQFITAEATSDADQQRGHTIPFHTDQIFQFNKAVINEKFFSSEEEDDGLKINIMSVDQRTSSPLQMLDVFLTPMQNSDSEEMSPQEDGSSGNSSSNDTLVGSSDFTKKADLVNKELDKADSTEDKSLVEEINGEDSELKDSTTLQIEGESVESDVVEAESEKASEETEESKTDDTTQTEQAKPTGQPNNGQNENAVASKGEENKVVECEAVKEGSVDGSTDLVLGGYLEKSKDVDTYSLVFDDDDDDETVCREELEQEDEVQV